MVLTHSFFNKIDNYNGYFGCVHLWGNMSFYTTLQHFYHGRDLQMCLCWSVCITLLALCLSSHGLHTTAHLQHTIILSMSLLGWVIARWNYRFSFMTYTFIFKLWVSATIKKNKLTTSCAVDHLVSFFATLTQIATRSATIMPHIHHHVNLN